MNTSELLRGLTCLSGVVLLVLSFLAFVKKRMTEGVGLSWGLFALVLFFLGLFPGLSVWTKYIVGKGAIALFVLLLAALFGAFSMSCTVSKLVMKNRELAMQVSLLNQEYEMFMREFRSIRERLDKQEDKIAGDSKDRKTV